MEKEIKQILKNQIAIMKVLRGDGRYEYTTMPISDTVDLLNDANVSRSEK